MKPTKLFFRLLFCTFMLNVFFMNAQQDNYKCAFDDDSYIPLVSCNQTGSADPTILDQFDPIVVNVKFWGINRPNGGGNDFPNREHESLTAIAKLNIYFNEYKIFFKYGGYEEFDSPIHYWDQDGDGIPDPDLNGFYILEQTYPHISALEEWASQNGKKDANAVNVYLYGYGVFGGWGGYPDKFTVGKNSGAMTTPGMLHEMGHDLTLYHTRSGSEHVTRKEFLPDGSINPSFNARTAGDRVEDTAAEPGYLRRSDGTYPYIDANCNYIFGFQFDNSDEHEAYDPTPADVANILSDAYDCVDYIVTVGQGIRAREALACGDYAPAIVPISSLYEPYSGEYFDPNLPNDVLYKPLFQPGFEYRFLECDCDCPEPVAYENINFSYTQYNIKEISKFEEDYSKIYHPNHSAIGIKIENEPIFWPQPRRCYDNPYRKPNSGSVTLFNDGIFNGNVTLMPKDSTGINNPNLIDELPSGLYVIDKIYSEGNTEQTVIQKSGN